MPSSPAGSGLDLALELPSGLGRRAALEAALRDAIRAGRLGVGTVLPSSRALAADLGIARGTVTAAYEHLVAEGWLVARPGASTAVAAGPANPGAATADHRTEVPLHDFHPGLPTLDAFPRRAWAQALRKALAERPDGDIWCRDLQGDHELRVRLVEHLGRARGVVADPDALVICSGFTQAFALVAAALSGAGARVVAVEDPSHPLYRRTLATAGLEVVAVPVDVDGLRVDQVPADAAAVFVTPGHQYPTGVALSADRRRELVARARLHGTLVFEDDYFGDLRYGGPPITALQALAPELVIYSGSVSKSLTPGLRVGWIVAPPALRPTLLDIKQVSDNGTSALEQIAFSELLASGTYGRHVRRQRRRYRHRRDHLAATIRRRAPQVRVHSLAAGLYCLVELPPGVAAEAVVADAADRRLRLVQIAECWTRDPPAGLLAIGFAAPPEHSFRQAVEQLADLLAHHTGAP